MGLVIYDEAQKIWHTTWLQGNEVNKQVELHGYKRLQQLFQAGESYYFIFNVKLSVFEFISPEMKSVLGYDADSMDITFFLSLIHPDDQPYFLNFERAIQEFLQPLPTERALKYKLRYDFRIRNAQQQYIRLLHQMIILQLDEGINYKTLGFHSDITYLKELGKPVLSFIGLDGEPSYTNVDVKEIYSSRKGILSNRESEIVCALANGLQSKEIAETLFISKTTVDKHRRNILAKTNTASTAELVAKAIREGWI
ncbi:LuxR C-terminal-related transcriptional regulator [Paraflavitalea pollutisoli]|uniref:LuxR C-terminal-related transcriptional regulator n=1 Tax=Paraflavitalea pollutisoli TaxID=3034143 RepID=UPI0023EC7BD2|nr:LuxR C-terminal-related transcriptional regulator [Paraflavitalea sp. H1-2-19X]